MTEAQRTALARFCAMTAGFSSSASAQFAPRSLRSRTDALRESESGSTARLHCIEPVVYFFNDAQNRRPIDHKARF
jgi:hypothetical protein